MPLRLPGLDLVPHIERVHLVFGDLFLGQILQRNAINRHLFGCRRTARGLQDLVQVQLGQHVEQIGLLLRRKSGAGRLRHVPCSLSVTANAGRGRGKAWGRVPAVSVKYSGSIWAR